MQIQFIRSDSCARNHTAIMVGAGGQHYRCCLFVLSTFAVCLNPVPIVMRICCSAIYTVCASLGCLCPSGCSSAMHAIAKSDDLLVCELRRCSSGAWQHSRRTTRMLAAARCAPS
jgi:hypothetical protein